MNILESNLDLIDKLTLKKISIQDYIEAILGDYKGFMGNESKYDLLMSSLSRSYDEAKRFVDNDKFRIEDKIRTIHQGVIDRLGDNSDKAKEEMDELEIEKMYLRMKMSNLTELTTRYVKFSTQYLLMEKNNE